MLGVAVVEGLAVDDVALPDGEAGAAEHAHLLGLVVVDRRLPAERVEVVVGERLLRHRRGCRAIVPSAHSSATHAADHLAHAIEIAGDELQRRVPERRAAAVGQRDPAVEVGRLVVARDGQHVVGVPRQLAGQIRRLDAMLASAPPLSSVQISVGREYRLPGSSGKPDVIGVHAGDDLAADLPDRRVVVAEQPRLHFFLARRSALLPRAHERDVAADVLAQQLVGLEQVVLVVLLEDADARRLGERAEVHGRRIHRRGDVHEVQIGRCRAQAAGCRTSRTSAMSEL